MLPYPNMPCSLTPRSLRLNVLNRVNLNGIDNNLPDGTYRKSIAQFNPCWMQVAMHFTFQDLCGSVR
jgi:hypothetical protein